MKMTEKIDRLMLERGINRKQLSEATGIPYPTISSFYDKGTENVKLSNLLKLADYFDCSLDYIADDTVEEKKGPPSCVKEDEPEYEVSVSFKPFDKRINDLSKKDRDKLFRIVEVFLEE